MSSSDSIPEDLPSDRWERGLRAFSSSVTGSFLFAALRRGRAGLASSTAGREFRHVAHEAGTAARKSRVADAVRWGDRVVRTSWLYRWLTAEPEADVVVIDLRETMTVGPILLLLERTAGPGAEYWKESRFGKVATRFTDQLAARPISVVSTVALIAILVNLCLLVVLGTPAPRSIGVVLVVTSLALAGTRVRLSADELTDTDVYALLVALLEPPDPPEDREDPPAE
jgi:hypothetical protein